MYWGQNESSRSPFGAEALLAPAPAPSAGALAPQADGSFTLGPCANATLLNSTHMRLLGVPPSVAWLQFSPQHRAGTLPTVRSCPLHRLCAGVKRMGSSARRAQDERLVRNALLLSSVLCGAGPAQQQPCLLRS